MAPRRVCSRIHRRIHGLSRVSWTEIRSSFHRRPPNRPPPPPPPRLKEPRLLKLRAPAPLFMPPKALSRESPDEAGRLKEELGAGREKFADGDGRETLGDGLGRLKEDAGAGRAAADVAPELQPRACAVAVEPGAPDLLRRLESGAARTGVGRRRRGIGFWSHESTNGSTGGFFQLPGWGSRDFTVASSASTSFTCWRSVGQSGSSRSNPG